MNKIIVFAPHSDDETLGAGGYLLKHKAEGDKIYWVNVTNAKKEYGFSDTEIEYWNDAIKKVANRFDFDGFYDLGLEPAKLDNTDMIMLIQRIRDIFDDIKPDIILVPYYGDAHSDHKVVFDAVMVCCKSFRAPYVKKIMCMEIISETDYALSDEGFVPNVYVDITDYIDEKIEILKIYESEIQESPFPRSEDAVKALAKFRGAACFADYAEAFKMIKCIER